MAKKKAKRTINVDFTGVEAGGVVLPEGNYEVKVVEVESKTSDNSGNEYLSWEFQVVSPEKHKGKKLYHNSSLTPQSLWSLRGLLEQLGVETPDEPTELDLDDLIDRTVGAEVQHEDYNGKNKARITQFFEFSSEEETDEEEEVEEEKPVAKKSSKKAAKPVVEDEDEEEEKPAAKKSRIRKAKKPALLTEDEVLEKDEEELATLIEENELEIDLDDYNTLRRKRSAVIEALEEKGLIEVAEEA